MTVRLPLFPLGTVLFPGQPLPLHVFEPRYRLLVRDLMDQPPGTERRFGVIAIRAGREVGSDGIHALYDVGCTAELVRVAAQDDGRFDIVTVGGVRFRLHRVDDSLQYLQGEVDLLPDDDDGGAAVTPLATGVAARFFAYLEALGAGGMASPVASGQHADALALSYAVAAGMVLEVTDRQSLLAAPDVGARLRRELRLLGRETALIRQLRSLPAAELVRMPYAQN